MPEITMPRLSDTMEDGVVSVWLKKVGDTIARGEILAEIETDKALMELEAYDDGVLEQILVQAGARVPIGSPIAVVGDAVWERLVACLGWTPDLTLATLAARIAARAELDARLTAWTRERSAEAAAETLQAAGVSAMPVMNGDDLRGDAHLAARGALVTVTHPEIGAERHAGRVIRMSRTPMLDAAAAPCLAADTADVLVRWLGLGHDEVARLADEGVCR